MKQWLLSCSVVLCLLWLCAPSAWADGDAPELLPRCQKELPEAIADLKSPERSFVVSDGSNPSGAILLTQGVTMLWRLMGCPAPKENSELPFYAEKSSYYYTAFLWAYQKGLLVILGLELENPEAFGKTFAERKLHNGDVARLLYHLEGVRLRAEGKTLALPETIPSDEDGFLTIYKDGVLTTYKDVPKDAICALALLWAGDPSRNFISGILGEPVENAVYFRPWKEEIGKGVCTRGQFFVLLHLYAQYMEKTGNPERKAA